jgi:hypothetical protein
MYQSMTQMKITIFAIQNSSAWFKNKVVRKYVKSDYQSKLRERLKFIINAWFRENYICISQIYRLWSSSNSDY